MAILLEKNIFLVSPFPGAGPAPPIFFLDVQFSKTRCERYFGTRTTIPIVLCSLHSKMSESTESEVLKHFFMRKLEKIVEAYQLTYFRVPSGFLKKYSNKTSYFPSNDSANHLIAIIYSSSIV